jgi:hypothetical protein
MASVIKAGNATDGVQVTSDNTGILELKTGTGAGTTAVTIGTNQAVTFAGAVTSSGNQTVTGNLTVNGNTTLGDANTDTILMTAAPSIGGAGLGMGFGFRNRIINGAMVIDQRNAGATISAGDGSFAVDRFPFYHQSGAGSKGNIARNLNTVTPPAGFTNYYGFQTTSAYSVAAGDGYAINQRIEGYNVADLGWGAAGAQTVTLSFWVRSSLTGTFGGAARNNDDNRSYPFTYTISSANTWEYKTITIPGDTSGTWNTANGSGLKIFWGVGVGSTYSGTAGSWAGSAFLSATGAVSVVATLNATFYITGVQLEKGSTATSFDYRPYGTELQLCQRYCQVISGAGVSNNYQRIGYGPGTSTSGGLTQVQLKATMRIAPTLTATAANTFTVFDGVTLTALTSLAIDAANSQNLAYVVWSVAGTPLTATRAYELLFNNTASGSFALSAEL